MLPGADDMLVHVLDVLLPVHSLLCLFYAVVTLRASCQRDGGSDNNQNMEYEELVNDIKQHIIGTWVHDGDCFHPIIETPNDEIIIKDNLEFIYPEKHIFIFNPDGSVMFKTENVYSPQHEMIEFDGRWEVGCLIYNGDIPLGLSISYSQVSGYNTLFNQFIRVLFSPDYGYMYLLIKSGMRMYRFKRQT